LRYSYWNCFSISLAFESCLLEHQLIPEVCCEDSDNGRCRSYEMLESSSGIQMVCGVGETWKSCRNGWKVQNEDRKYCKKTRQGIACRKQNTVSLLQGKKYYKKQQQRSKWKINLWFLLILYLFLNFYFPKRNTLESTNLRVNVLTAFPIASLRERKIWVWINKAS